MKRKVILHHHFFKNAGTSVDHLLKMNFPGAWVTHEFSATRQPENNAKVGNWILEQGKAIAFSSHTAMLPPPILANIEIFPIVFVRHPIDRIASAYAFESTQGGDGFGAVLARNTTLSGYVEVRLSLHTDRQCRDFHMARLAPMINGEGVDEADKAMQALKTLPFVGIVEQFDASTQRLAEFLRPHFPGFRVAEVAKNVTRNPSLPLEQRLAVIRAKVGDACYAQLVEANQRDLELWHFVHESYNSG